MIHPFNNKVAVITGAGQGQGAHLARRFYEDGARVALLELNEEQLHKMIKEFDPDEPERFVPYTVDVSHSDEVNDVFKRIGDQFGEIAFLINNAGILHKGTIESSTDEHIHLMIDVNLKGTMYATRAAIPHMKKSGGSILNVSSILATFPNTGAGAYGAAKSGIITLTRIWAAELAPYNIRVNAYAPGTIDTPMMAEIFAQRREESKLAQIPLRRFGTCEDVYNVVRFFCAEESAYLTGQTIGIDGGIWATQTPTAAWGKKS